MEILKPCIQFCMFAIDINGFYIALFLLIMGFFSPGIKAPEINQNWAL